MPSFGRYIGIDYSGAETPTSSLKGLRVYMADRASPPSEVLPPPSPRKYWTRRGIAEWLVERLAEDQHDSYCIATWLLRADQNGSLAAFLKPDLTPPESTLAQLEGWILGVPGLIREGDLHREAIPRHSLY